MEIKRRLNKIASSLSPQIEVLNIADEMRRLCDRFEELVAYGQEKVDRAARKEKTIGQKVAEQKAANLKEIQDHQQAEADENLRDQEESKKERDARANKSKKPEPGVISDELAKETLESTMEKPPVKKKAKKKAKPVNKAR